MRVNIYAEEMTDRVEIISKEIDGQAFTGLRIYLELPATVGGQQYQGPFMHRPGDDDSSAVTFWGKRDLREVLRKALVLLDEHYAARGAQSARQFPILGGDRIPWDLIAPHEAQALRNHNQSLEVLASRGGLSAVEAIAVIEGKHWRTVTTMTVGESATRLQEIVAAYQQKSGREGNG